MERGALGQSIPENGQDGDYTWKTVDVSGYKATMVKIYEDFVIAVFFGEQADRMERVALFLTTEQS